jgi:hypothetical protein
VPGATIFGESPGLHYPTRKNPVGLHWTRKFLLFIFYSPHFTLFYLLFLFTVLQLSAWAAGGGSTYTPPEAGFAMGPLSTSIQFIILEVHYNNPNGTGGYPFFTLFPFTPFLFSCYSFFSPLSTLPPCAGYLSTKNPIIALLKIITSQYCINYLAITFISKGSV